MIQKRKNMHILASIAVTSFTIKEKKSKDDLNEDCACKINGVI